MPLHPAREGQPPREQRHDDSESTAARTGADGAAIDIATTWNAGYQAGYNNGMADGYREGMQASSQNELE